MKALILSPHPDDGLLAMGGTIAKMIEEKWEIRYSVFSWAEQGFSKEEIKNAVLEIGIPESHLDIMNYEVRSFPYFGSEIRQDMINMRNQFKPDAVFIHNSFDIHQDHKVVSEEGFRAFREGTLYGYILPWNIRAIKFDRFYELQKKHIDKKLSALKKLQSQQWRYYYNSERVVAMAITMGLFRRKDFAEPFEILSEIK